MSSKRGGGRGSPIFKSKSKNTTQKVIFLRKTKIAPYGLKCKINHKKFSTKGFPKGGGVAVGGGGLPFGKNYRFFYCTPYFSTVKVLLYTSPHPDICRKSICLGIKFSELCELLPVPLHTRYQEK